MSRHAAGLYFDQKIEISVHGSLPKSIIALHRFIFIIMMQIKGDLPGQLYFTLSHLKGYSGFSFVEFHMLTVDCSMCHQQPC